MSKVINNNFPTIQQMSELLNKQNTSVKKGSGERSFDEILQAKALQKTENLKFSKHASERLVSRNIDLTEAQLDRLQAAARRADEKGIKESLVMLDDLAFIVNVKNKTVITAVGDNEDKIFTNIDGAVIV